MRVLRFADTKRSEGGGATTPEEIDQGETFDTADASAVQVRIVKIRHCRYYFSTY